MKNKSILTAALLSAVSFTACDDMLDTDPRVTEMTQATFPGKAADVEALNAGTYSIMSVLGGGDADTYNIFWWWEVMSDNCYGSGGLQDNKAKSLHHLVEMSADQYEGPFLALYGGVSRANNQIETIDNVPWRESQKAQRNQLLGEAYFMRGLYTLWLTQLYGDVPLITSTLLTADMRKQVSAEESIYPQILSDFVSAKNLMSETKSSGHANKFVAEAFAARAYMFWAGFYKNVSELATGSCPNINLVAQEGCEAASLSKQDIIDGLKDVINKGGYKLCEDYRSLWQYSNSFLWKEAQDGYAGDGNEGVGHAYNFIKDMDPANCFDMPGMGNGNTEELFQIQFMNASSWNLPMNCYSSQRGYTNYLGCWWGLRVNGDNGDKDHTYPFNEGWGQGTPSCNIWDDWTIAENNQANPYTDKRKLGSIIDCVNEFKQNGQKGYSFVKDDCEESGYAVKKWCGVCSDGCSSKNDTWWTQCEGYSGSSLGNSMQGDHFMDFYLMRYADVLLMATELTGDAQYMNLVQRRAGVPETGYSLKAVQDERRWEFAFEGLRFNDMRRWSGNKPTENSYAAKALQAQDGKLIVCLGDADNKIAMKHMTSSWAKRYIATNGFLAKPQSQITLMNGDLEQNPGWNTADPETQYKTLY